MGAPKKSAAKVSSSDDPVELARVPLQAILLADSFATNFRPITLERPKVLLPLVNVPMIEYTLAWLELAGVEEVFVFCCAHAKQVTSYIENSQWCSQPNFTVTTIESHNSISAGDALRLIYERNVIHGDFVLISGDTLSNMSLARALQDHKDRRKKDNNAVMTMIIKRSKPSSETHQSRLGTEELFVAIDPTTKQLLYYEENSNHLKGTLSLDKMLLVDKSSITLHNDMQDCYIDICSPEVLSLFTDNFDYQHLRRHFVKGLLVDDIMGYKIFTHEIHSSYAARIDNYRGYDTISKDIIQRWTYPLVPDILFSGDSPTRLERQGMYRASEIQQSRSAKVGPLTVIGSGTVVGSNAIVVNSVIGKGCTIGSNVLIEGSYVWDNVVIEDGCELRHAIVCDGVIMKSGSRLEPRVVLSFKVVIGPNFVVPQYSKVSLLQQPTVEDSDEELEYADNISDTIHSSIKGQVDKLNGALPSDLSGMQQHAISELGLGGMGYIWSICEGCHEEEWKHSVAPIPSEKLAEITRAIEDDLEYANIDSNAPASSGELKPDTQVDSEDDENEDNKDDSAYFEKEVEATFLRAVNESIEVEHVILEVNSLRLSYNMQAVDCAGAIFFSMMKLSSELSHSTASELYKNVASVVSTWRTLLKFYLPGKDEEIEVILKFEEICLESAKGLSPLFTQVSLLPEIGLQGLPIRCLLGYDEASLAARIKRDNIATELSHIVGPFNGIILHFLYEKDILSEEAIQDWETEKADADESDRIFVKQAEKFLQWLREASEED